MDGFPRTGCSGCQPVGCDPLGVERLFHRTHLRSSENRICMMICNSGKITVMKQQQINLVVGNCTKELNCTSFHFSLHSYLSSLTKDLITRNNRKVVNLWFRNSHYVFPLCQKFLKGPLWVSCLWDLSFPRLPRFEIAAPPWSIM